MSSVETEPQEAPQAADAPYQPWPDAASFEVHKKIGLEQIQDELVEALGEPCHVSLVTEVPFSEDGILWVKPDSVDRKVVQSTIDAHEFTEGYGAPGYLADFKALIRKINDDPGVELSETDIQVALKGLLAQVPTTNG